MSPLCRLRRFLGLTQRDVAEATGIALSRLAKAESRFGQLSDGEEATIREYLAGYLQMVRQVEAEAQQQVEVGT
jgi:transcriptional regulator with XRE-family HTH domain